MSTTLLLLAAMLQQAPLREPSGPPAPWPDERDLGDGVLSNPRTLGARASSDPVARRSMARYGACLADSNAERASRLLQSNYREPEYRETLDEIVRNSSGCNRLIGTSRHRRSAMRSNSVLAAGAMAERLLDRDSVPLKNRLARAARAPATQAFGPGDALAICMVRSTPDDIATLFATDVATAAEDDAAKRLKPVMTACAQGRKFDINTEGLRAMLATAAYRGVAAAPAQTSSR